MSEDTPEFDSKLPNQHIQVLVEGLNAMRDTLLELSLLAKDYKANLDFRSHGETLRAANAVISKVALKL